MALQIRPEQEQRLQQLAAQSGLSADEYLRRQLDSVLAYEEDIATTVKRGDEHIEAGRLIPHEEVFKRLEERLRGR